VLRFYEGMTESEIAECLQITVGTVRSQTAKGLARLRELAPTIRTEDSR
jgi:DNA-directed RNA polymerase specialized sigma24 family protein